MFDQVLGSLLLSVATNLSNQHDSLGLRITQEYFQAIDKVGSVERITANADAQRLSQTNLGLNICKLKLYNTNDN